jgi:cytoskeletal protein RodZ
VRCSRCGNENSATNRFCGMCGASLLPSSALPTPPAILSRAEATPPPEPVRKLATPAPAEPRQQSPAFDRDQVPIISGPSFLGLNQPAPPSSRRETNLKSDAQQERSSRNLDYLLEDEEEEPRSGAWKFVFIVIALVLAVGFGYLQWRSGGFAWLTADTKKPPVTVPTPDAAQSSSTADAPSTAPDSAAAPSVNQPAAAESSSPPNGSAVAGESPAPTAPSATTPAPNTPTATDATSAIAPTSTTPTATKDAASAADASDSSAVAPGEKAAEPLPARTAPKPRVAARPAPVTPVDPVTQAERYIYGRGVTQDCDRGLRMLRPAAEHSNSKAMISLGALYSAGLCTPRDLPTAYRWFALALRREPDNQPVQTDLQKLWSEMTPPERQLAIKLSQ